MMVQCSAVQRSPVHSIQMGQGRYAGRTPPHHIPVPSAEPSIPSRLTGAAASTSRAGESEGRTTDPSSGATGGTVRPLWATNGPQAATQTLCSIGEHRLYHTRGIHLEVHETMLQHSLDIPFQQPITRPLSPSSTKERTLYHIRDNAWKSHGCNPDRDMRCNPPLPPPQNGSTRTKPQANPWKSSTDAQHPLQHWGAQVVPHTWHTPGSAQHHATAQPLTYRSNSPFHVSFPLLHQGAQVVPHS